MSSITIADAQKDMRHGYYSGAPGVFTSALIWLIAAVTSLQLSPKQAVLALLIGGMFIFPASVLITKMLGRPGSHSKGNPLGALAMEGTLLLIACLPLAYVISVYKLEWFFPAMLLIIGGRYLTFSTIYGLRIYWALGGCLAIVAFVLVAIKATPVIGAFSGAIIELAFAIIIYLAARKSQTA